MEPVTLLDTRIYAMAIDGDISRTSRRQAERQAVGELVRQAFGSDSRLMHRPDGAPYIEGYGGHISVTHSIDTAMLAVCDTQPVGIDADHQRAALWRVAPRFLSLSEMAVTGDSLGALAAAWTLKEAMFKALSHTWLPHSRTLADIPLPEGFVAPGLLPGALVVALYRADGRYIVTDGARFNAADL